MGRATGKVYLIAIHLLYPEVPDGPVREDGFRDNRYSDVIIDTRCVVQGPIVLTFHLARGRRHPHHKVRRTATMAEKSCQILVKVKQYFFMSDHTIGASKGKSPTSIQSMS